MHSGFSYGLDHRLWTIDYGLSTIDHQLYHIKAMLQVKCRKLLLFVYVCIDLKKKRIYLHRIITGLMLWVFSIAITPWSALHHHEVISDPIEKNCTHKFHVKSQGETCLICKAHFEKNYTVAPVSFTTFLKSDVTIQHHPIVTSSFTELISTSLRGPPATS